MGKLLGYHADEGDFDRPDLNKCPNCNCYFPQDTCPICKMECPEEMRAGNRAPVKKKRRKASHGSSRVVFVNWYHSTWFIILMMFVFPVVAFILAATTPHKKSAKIALSVAAAVFAIVSYFGVDYIAGSLKNYFEAPVETSVTREEYIDRCVSVRAEEFYRSSENYAEEFISVKVKIIARITDVDAEYEYNKYPIYYVCTAAEGTGEYYFLVRNCFIGENINFIPGDVITVYGEGDEFSAVTDAADYKNYDAPVLNGAYYGK